MAFRLPRLPRIDLIPGTDYDALIVTITTLALVYVASGNWSEERWVKAVGTAGPVNGALIFGKRKEQLARRESFDEGLWTPNPQIHMDEILEGAVQRAIASVTTGVADVAVDHVAGLATDHAVGLVTDALAGDGGREPEKRRDEAKPKRGEGKARPRREKLPPGWRRDAAGRLRDEHGRYVSRAVLKDALAELEWTGESEENRKRRG